MMNAEDQINFLQGLKNIVGEIARLSQNMTQNVGGKDSFEMKMNAQGRRYYDIKMYRGEGESMVDYIARYDELNKALDQRARQGE